MKTNWNNLIDRVKKETSYRLGNNSDGAAVIRIKLIVSANDEILGFLLDSTRIEPSGVAKDNLLELL